MIPRENYMSRIRPFIDTELIKVLTGVRRSGKSVLLGFIQEELLARGVAQKNIIAFNFESLANASFLTAEALYQELSLRIAPTWGRAYLFFDEIQEVQGWEKCLNSARVDFDCDIYVTGSNATLLSGELATYLGGRYVEFVVYPFSFEEFLSSRGTDAGNPQLPDLFRTYMDVGGMPVLSSLPDDREVALKYLMDVYNSIILKDIVRRNNIRDVDLLERIVAYVMANVGQTFSANSIARYLKSEHRRVAPETVLNYVKACCSAHLFAKVERQDVQGKALLAINEKYYVVDQGLRQAVYGGNGRDVSQVLENIVCMEALRRGYRVTVGKLGEREVDFVLEKTGETIYVQVAYLIATEDTARREFEPLQAIRDNYPKYVVSLDDVDLSRGGIIHRNIRQFLLASAW